MHNHLERHDICKEMNVLLVEDNPADVRLMIEAFKDCDCNCIRNIEIASDGVEAMDFLTHQLTENVSLPDMIILDLNLPKKDGREVLKEIKNNLRLKKIPVIILTSSSACDDVTTAYENHANCYMKKPYQYEQFTEIIERINQFWLDTALLPSMCGCA